MRDFSAFYDTQGYKIIANFGETSEFKNVCDGLGDHVKSALRNAIIRQDLVLTKPQSYFVYCQEHMTFTPETRGDHKMIRRSFY